MKIIKNNLIPFKGYYAMAIFPFIFVRGNNYPSKRTIRHESIHFEQQKELLIIGFYILYLMSYVIGILRYWNLDKAYRKIPFEREAYGNQNNRFYLDSRKRFSWIKYI